MPAKGDGISKRKDGRYMARYTVQTPDGPKRSRARYVGWPKRWVWSPTS